MKASMALQGDQQGLGSSRRRRCWRGFGCGGEEEEDGCRRGGRRRKQENRVRVFFVALVPCKQIKPKNILY